MKLDYFSALKKIPSSAGVWFIHGDEPLLAQNILIAFRQYWKSDTDIERERVDLNNAADWSYALSLLDNQSLFASRTALEVHGHYKADNNDLIKLERFAKSAVENILVINFPKQDKKSQSTKFYQLLEAHATIVELSISNDKERKLVLQEEAKKYGLNLHSDAWVMLEDNSQNNLFAASQALLKLSFSHASEREITVEHLKTVLVDQSRFSLYDLVDVALIGNAEKVVQILRFLQESGEQPTLVLWALAKEMRLILQLAAEPHAFMSNCKAFFIWSSKQHLYKRAMQRVIEKRNYNYQRTSEHWLGLLLNIDESIKGVGFNKPWDLLLQAALLISGITLFELK